MRNLIIEPVEVRDLENLIKNYRHADSSGYGSSSSIEEFLEQVGKIYDRARSRAIVAALDDRDIHPFPMRSGD